MAIRIMEGPEMAGLTLAPFLVVRAPRVNRDPSPGRPEAQDAQGKSALSVSAISKPAG